MLFLVTDVEFDEEAVEEAGVNDAIAPLVDPFPGTT